MLLAPLNGLKRAGRTLASLACLLALSIGNANAAVDQIVWENQGIAPDGAIANGATLTDSLGYVTATYGLTITNLPTSSSTFNAGITGNHTGYARLAFDNNDDNNADRMVATITFSQPVSNLQFSLLDVDDGNFRDAVEILYNGTNNARTDGFVTSFGAGVALDDETYMTGYEGIASSTPTDTTGNINLNFGTTAVTSVTVRFFSSDDAPANPVAQFIGISDLTFNVARLTLRKTWVGATLNNAVTVAATRGGTTLDTLNSVANTANETDTDPSPSIVLPGNVITFTEAFTAGAATNYSSSLACTGAADGNPADGLTIAAADGDVVCTYTNTRRPTVTVTKVSNGGVGSFAFSGTNGFAAQNITTTTAGVGVAGATQVLTVPSTATTITESAPPAGFVLSSITCTGLGAGGTATPTINGSAGGSVLLNAAATAPGSNIACTFTNTLASADLSILKTNAASSVVSGTTTAYTITVGNAGPGSVTNALVRDTAGTGLTGCVVSTPCSVTSGTATCPAAANLTYANLSGAGVAVPSMGTNSTIQFQVTCNVQ